jgi:hypothetical protein
MSVVRTAEGVDTEGAEKENKVWSPNNAQGTLPSTSPEHNTAPSSTAHTS